MTYPLKRLAPFLALLCVPATAQGSLISSVGSITLAPGDTGLVDVLIRSDISDRLQAFGVRLQLDAPNDRLRLTKSPTNAELLDDTYVFAGDSDAIRNGSTATVSTIATADDTYDGADSTASLRDVTITTDDRLLVRLEVTALIGATQGTYDLRFDDAVSTFYDARANAVPFSSTHGAVTIVPEPNCLALLSLGSLLAATCRRRRH